MLMRQEVAPPVYSDRPIQQHTMHESGIWRCSQSNNYSQITTTGNHNTIGTTREGARANFDGINISGDGNRIGDHTDKYLGVSVVQDDSKQTQYRKSPRGCDSSSAPTNNPRRDSSVTMDNTEERDSNEKKDNTVTGQKDPRGRDSQLRPRPTAEATGDPRDTRAC